MDKYKHESQVVLNWNDPLMCIPFGIWFWEILVNLDRRATGTTMRVNCKYSIAFLVTFKLLNCISWGFPGWAHHWDGPKGPQIPLEFNPGHNQDWTLSSANVTQVRYLRPHMQWDSAEMLFTVVAYFQFFFTIVYVIYYVVLSSAAWRSVRLCAPDWALWWTADLNAWVASNTSRTGEEDPPAFCDL